MLLNPICNPCFLSISSTNALKIPVGTTLQRPASPQAGMIRYNTLNNNYEGYDGTYWRVLNGLYDVAQTTYIIPESSPGANDQTFYFYINNAQVADLNSSRFNIPGLQVQNTVISNNIISTNSLNTDLTFSTSGTGSVIVENFQINGNVITNTVPNSITTFTQSGTGDRTNPSNPSSHVGHTPSISWGFNLWRGPELSG